MKERLGSVQFLQDFESSALLNRIESIADLKIGETVAHTVAHSLKNNNKLFVLKKAARCRKKSGSFQSPVNIERIRVILLFFSL